MNILDTIVREKRAEIEHLDHGPITPQVLKEAVKARGGVRNFEAALRRPKSGRVALIAEIKKASPSAGLICADFDPAKIARQYEAAGADCLSVLTDEKFFQGSREDLRQVRRTVRLPLLRKDFIIDERQILEAVQWGADAVLLITAILSYRQLKHFHALTMEAGLAALVEVHDEAELEQAMMVGARLIGINNRDWKAFKVDLATTERLAGRVRSVRGGSDKIVVAESGIHTRADVERLADCGAQAILVGESLMKSDDFFGKITELLSDNEDRPPLESE